MVIRNNGICHFCYWKHGKISKFLKGIRDQSRNRGAAPHCFLGSIQKTCLERRETLESFLGNMHAYI